MTTSDSNSGETPIDDPDWIKGLVAKALLQAAEDEPEPFAEPPSKPAALAPDTSSTVTPDQSGPEILDTRLGVGGATPSVPTPSAAGTPLVVGRVLGEHPPPTSAGGIPAAAGAAPTEPSPAPISVGATAVADAQTGEPTTLQAEPVLDELGESTGDEPRDHVMVEADATVEGFRSSDIRTVLEWLAVIVSALVVALIIKAFVLQAFWIPSESMESTVNKGDRILVNKLSYRLHDIRRGDLVVFKKLPGTPGDTEDLIKRAIALPGETIEVRDDGRIWIWGPGETPEDALLLQEPYLDPRNERLAAPSSTDSLSTDVWDEACTNQPRQPGRCTLAADQYFMMGDNRTSSSDSRFFGPVPEDLVVGRAFLRIWPLGEVSSL